MRKLFILLLLAILMPGAANAQRKKSKTKESQKGSSLLWEIKGPGIAGSSYLFGTIHATCPMDAYIPAQVNPLLNKDRLLVLETGGMESMENPLALVGLSAMGNNQTLPRLLPDTSFQLIKKFFADSLRLDIKPFERMKPLLLLAMLFPKMLGCQPISSESLLEQISKDAGGRSHYLEKPEEQLRIIDRIDYKLQAEGLYDAVKNYTRYKRDMEFLIMTYQMQDLDGLLLLINSTSGLGDNFEELMLNSRNRKWMESLPDLMVEKPVFIAVGAGHLPGEEGLINLMRKKGYTLTPIH